jgi:hypothetical protein
MEGCVGLATGVSQPSPRRSQRRRVRFLYTNPDPHRRFPFPVALKSLHDWIAHPLGLGCSLARSTPQPSTLNHFVTQVTRFVTPYMVENECCVSRSTAVRPSRFVSRPASFASQPFYYSSNSFCGPIYNADPFVRQRTRLRIHIYEAMNSATKKRPNDGFCRASDRVCRPIHSEENNLTMKPNAMKLRIPSLPWLPSVESPFRVFRDHKSRRDRLSLGTIIVAALGRQFRGLKFRRPPSSCSVFRGSNLRNPCPSVVKSSRFRVFREGMSFVSGAS